MWVKQLVKGAISAVFLCTQLDSTLDFEEKICSSKWRSKYARKARIYWLVVWNMNLIVHFIYGVSSFPLTNSLIFFKMVNYCTTNQHKRLMILYLILPDTGRSEKNIMGNISRHWDDASLFGVGMEWPQGCEQCTNSWLFTIRCYNKTMAPWLVNENW
jgi:hypothetical protein